MADPASVNYALALDGAALHVALALDKAAPAALSFEELTKDYHHGVPADLTRIRRHEKLDDDKAATEWMIRHAVAHFGKTVEVVDDLVIIANGHRFEDLKFRGRKMERPGPDPHEKLRDPFNPMTGAFSDNIRVELHDDKDSAWDELRESMKTYGWVPEFPALVDERDVVLVGHRRLAIAKELGISPEKKRLIIGNGDAADARRLAIAIASNIASKRLSPNDRKRIALYLYEDHEWSQKRISEALAVDQKTVSTDLHELGVTPKSRRGRPRGRKPFVQVVEQASEANMGVDAQIFPLIEQGKNRNAIKEELGLSVAAVRDAQQRYVGHTRAKAITIMPAEAEHQCTCPVCGNQHTKGGES